jgi:hypothetical protein
MIGHQQRPTFDGQMFFAEDTKPVDKANGNRQDETKYIFPQIIQGYDKGQNPQTRQDDKQGCGRHFKHASQKSHNARGQGNTQPAQRVGGGDNASQQDTVGPNLDEGLNRYDV